MQISPVIHLFWSLFCIKRPHRSGFAPAIKKAVRSILPDVPRRAELVLACFIGSLSIFCLLVLITRCLSLWVVVDRLGRLARFAWFLVSVTTAKWETTTLHSVRKLLRFTVGLKPETPYTARFNTARWAFYSPQPQGPDETCRKPLKKWVILIALQFRYTFYRPQTKRLRARKIGLLGTACLGCPSGDVPCVSEEMACGYWFSKWQTTKSIWVR